MEIHEWTVLAGMLVCLSQSAMFSGLNLAFFSVSRLRLEAEAPHDGRARRVLALRRDSNLLLTTILWGNVAVNTLFALLSNSVLAGALAFVTSTLLITFFGEICPQALFSRNALAVASRLAPVLRVYQYLLWPVAKPSAMVLDRWLGHEAAQYMRERTLRNFILRHLEAEESEITDVEGRGALNFIDLDDVPAAQRGRPVSADSVIAIPFDGDKPRWPHFRLEPDDPFLNRIASSRLRWLIITDTAGQPRLALDADEFLRDAWRNAVASPDAWCHEPLVIRDNDTPLGAVIVHIASLYASAGSRPVEHDIALVWTPSARRIITGSDLLADLLRGIGPHATGDADGAWAQPQPGT